MVLECHRSRNAANEGVRMSRNTLVILGMLLVCAVWTVGCDDAEGVDETDADADGDIDSGSADGDVEDGGDGDIDENGDEDADADEPEIEPCSREGRRAYTIENGTELMTGITLEESTPIGEIVADREAFDGQPVQIEGIVMRICSNRGCWAELEDMTDGARLMLKVVDGTLDFREVTEVGGYAIGEGNYRAEGHPAQRVEIVGAIVSDAMCTD